MGLGNVPLSNDEYSMIFSSHFGINFRAVNTGKKPANDYGLIFTCMAQVTGAFVFAMLGCMLPLPFSLLCWVGVGCIIFFRALTVILFAWTVVRGKYLRKFYASSIMYWGYWPMSLFCCVIVATVLGSVTGDYLWSTALSPYLELKKLQKYTDVNPAVVPGVRIQDAGLVDFTENVAMDRAKGGCFMNKGDTYCIAPIVNGGEVKYGLAGMPASGSFDYFAVGINCCTCPNRDFKCGEWQNPMASGGIRSLDFKARPYYQLALDDWQASYGKTSKTPMFFEWTQGPEWQWKGMWNRTLYVGWLAVAAALSAGLLVGFLLDKTLQMLWQSDIISPRACFAPAAFCFRITEMLLPMMYYRYQQEQEDIAAMPVTAEWKAQQGGQEDGDTNKMAGGYGTY